MTYQQVPALHGVAWYLQGWRLFTRQPLLLLGMFYTLLVSLMALSLIPILGGLASTLLAPVLGAGLYQTLDTIADGQEASFELLFSGFRKRLQPLMLLGLILLGLEIVISLVLFLTPAGDLFSQLATAGKADSVQSSLPALWAIPFLILLALVLMAYQFALPLVALNGMEPAAAIKMSLLGEFLNWRALLVFGMIYLGVALLLALIGLVSAWLLLVGTILIVLLMPVLTCATYAAYRDIFQIARVVPTETIIA
jgi:uncharacterized membrane protein